LDTLRFQIFKGNEIYSVGSVEGQKKKKENTPILQSIDTPALPLDQLWCGNAAPSAFLVGNGTWV
jgi:hypothetical protein